MRLEEPPKQSARVAPQTPLDRRAFLALLAGAAAAPLAASASPEIYLATYAHIDPAWRWRLQEGLEQADSTFQSVLRTLRAFPDIFFSETSGAFYHWVRTTDPATFERVRSVVRSRHWEPVGGWWVEADVNIISGESLMRQAWYGKREFREHLGVETNVAFLPDSFGSSANLPAILKAQGFEYYVSGRGAFDHGPIPIGAFLWQSLGDASIVAYNNPVAGGTNDAITTVTKASQAETTTPLLVWFGLGDHGGGPNIASLDALRAFLKSPGSPAVRFSRVDDYMKRFARPEATRSGEIEGVFPGAFTNAYAIKRANIDAERALLDCERFDVLSALMGLGFEPPRLDQHWQTLLLNQHHDTISGTILRENFAAAIDQDRAVATVASGAKTEILQRIVDRIAHADDDDGMLIVFNPLPHPQRVLARYPLLTDDGRQALLFDAYGRAVPTQLSLVDGPLYRQKSPPTLFHAELPAFGYTAFRVRGTSAAPQAPSPSVPTTVGTNACAVAFDPHTGMPSSISLSGVNIPLNRTRFVVFSDKADTWGGDTLTVDPQSEAGVFSLSSMRLVENGPVRWVVEGRYTYNTSALRVFYEGHAGETALRITIDAHWDEPFARLALATDVAGADAHYDIPFGTITRNARAVLVPALSFVARNTRDKLAAIVSCGNHGFWATDSSMGVTLLRSTPYSSLDRIVDTVDQPFIDTGNHRIALMLRVSDDIPELRRAAEGFEREVPVLWNGVHDGSLPLSTSFASVDTMLTVPSLRRVDGTIEARVHNLGSEAVRGHGTIGAFALGADFDPCGIRTFRLRGTRFVQEQA